MLRAAGIDGGSSTIKAILVHEDQSVEVIAISPVGSRPLRAIRDILQSIRERLSAAKVRLGVTGSAGRNLCGILGIEAVDDSVALAAAFGALHPRVRTIVEMGMESQRFLALAPDEVTGRLRIEDGSMGHKCAAGSGSFLEHMRKRLNYPSIEEFATIAAQTEPPAALSGRCSVFTESDIVHLYQKGTPRERIAAGIHQAICRNYRSAMVKGKEIHPQVAFIGGVALNPAVLKYMRQVLGLSEQDLFVPEHARVMGAIGAALRAEVDVDLDEAVRLLDERLAQPISYPTGPRLTMEHARILTPPETPVPAGDIPLAALGVDIGSVSTKAALITKIDGRYQVLASYYRRTDGDPLAAVRDTVEVIQKQVQERGYRLGRVVAATTGSGRYLTADYLGADLIKNEITAQANGALAFIPEVESIFEIGGQDSKYIQIKDGVIVDFEMNKACAAGTGAFLEKQAANLGVPLQEFGSRALAGENPPELDWQCTVYSESAVHHYRQNNVPVDDLCAGICLASVRNYLNKNIGNRPIGKVVAFQGAVAFNRGMVAAYETALGRQIVVPPYPHLTGAVGAARIAYEEAPAEGTFRGFDAVRETRYTVSSFECAACANRCDVNTFQMEGGEKYFYNDRCEKYSGHQKHRRAVNNSLPDLFAEREEMLVSAYSGKAPEGAPRVGIPRGGMFNEYYPFYKAFLTELGFEVVPSDSTNNQIIRQGVQSVAAEPCFPIKVAHGHVADLLQKNVDYLFLPSVLRAEPLAADFCETQTCPYIQGLPELLKNAHRLEEKGIKVITPRLYFNRGRKHLRRAMGEAAAALVGPSGPPTASQIDRALDAAIEALGNFRRRLAKRGEEILQGLPPNSTAFVVLGRPYTLHDTAVNMDVGKKIQDLGILAIPQDFLPLAETDTATTWRGIYSRQVQNRLAAARLIREDARLRAVVLTYFGCGPDSFANQFFRDELSEPAYVMQIDEHTADAGVITRIEAFADTIRAQREPEPFEAFSTEAIHPSKATDKIIWIPDACTAATLLAESFRVAGFDARVLPRSPDPGLNLARSVISEDVCVPALYTTEDILYRTRHPDFKARREVFFQGNAAGPCRYGMYALLQRRILDKQGLMMVDMVTLGARNTAGGLNTTFTLVAWDALVTHDLLEKMLLHTRPYELNAGDCDAIFARYVEETRVAMQPHYNFVQTPQGKIAVAMGRHLDVFKDILRRAQEEFGRVPRSTQERPLVGLLGEFYVRLHDRSNQSIIRKLEQGGAEVWLAPITEFFGYANRIKAELCGEELKESPSRKAFLQWAISGFQDKLAVQDEHLLSQAALPYLEGLDEMTPAELIDKGEEFIHHTFGGEAICSMGKAVDFAQRGVDGIISAIPFNCMPGITVQALSHAMRRKYGNIPFLTLDYDGFVDSSRDSRLASFLAQVKERRLARQAA